MDLGILEEKLAYYKKKNKANATDQEFIDDLFQENKELKIKLNEINTKLEYIEEQESVTKLQNEILVKNMEDLTQQLINFENENTHLFDQNRLLNEKMKKLNYQIKTKNLMRVVKGGGAKAKITSISSTTPLKKLVENTTIDYNSNNCIEQKGEI